jgi:hypothetical protein
VGQPAAWAGLALSSSAIWSAIARRRSRRKILPAALVGNSGDDLQTFRQLELSDAAPEEERLDVGERERRLAFFDHASGGESVLPITSFRRRRSLCGRTGRQRQYPIMPMTERR